MVIVVFVYDRVSLLSISYESHLHYIKCTQTRKLVFAKALVLWSILLRFTFFSFRYQLEMMLAKLLNY